jgi:hypothetical protein
VRKKGFKVFMYILAVVMLLSLAMKFHVVAEFVAGIFNTTPEAIQSGASVVFDVAVGLMLVSLGVAAAASLGLIIGAVLVIVGLVFIASAIWTKFSKPKPVEQ